MKNLLASARIEILQLREQNKILSAQMGVVEIFAAALGMKRGNQCMSTDVAWELEREIERLEAEEARNIADAASR
jgi:hypothetical protein